MWFKYAWINEQYGWVNTGIVAYGSTRPTADETDVKWVGHTESSPK